MNVGRICPGEFSNCTTKTRILKLQTTVTDFGVGAAQSIIIKAKIFSLRSTIFRTGVLYRPDFLSHRY